MYIRIYKILNELLWMILAEKSIGETVVNTPFQHTFCQHVSVAERLFLLDFDKHSSLFIQLLHTYMLYIMFNP